MQIRGIILIIFTLFILSCSKKPVYLTNDGQVYGTFYHIVYENPDGIDLHQEIEEKFKEYTMSFSTFEKESVISKINNNQEVIPDIYFTNCFKMSQEISAITDGAFDISVAPMVNVWGFGFKNKEKITDKLIDSLRTITGYKSVTLENGQVIKENKNTMLDMSAIAKGYTCDLIGKFLAKKGCQNYLVEIGGEVVAKGVNQKGKTWTIGISEPSDNAFFAGNKLNAVIHLPDKALATSGNYRNFYIEDGVKYAHTIDPKTGYPVQHSLLSATVLADNCATADAYATAFMVLGMEKGIELAEKLPGIYIYFIYAGENGENKVYFSENFKSMLVE